MFGFGFRLEPGRRAAASVPASTITALEVLAAGGIQALDGADAADVNGWVAKVTLPDDAVSAFDPTKLVLTVSDPGFSAAGVAAVVTRTIRGGAIVRRQQPNQATVLNSASAGVRTVYVSLDDHVFAGSTVTASAEAGYYGAAAAGTVAGVVNASTRAYPKPIASWASLQHERRTGAFSPELVVTHLYGRNGRMAAGVRFSAADEGSGATGDIDVNAVALSAEATQGNPFEVFRPTVPLTNMAQGQRCILNAKVYPWLGDASAVLDLALDGAARGVSATGDWSNANPCTPLRFFCDKTGAYAGGVAVVESGATGGTVQATLAAARATPFPTMNAAYNALAAWNNTNRGHNDCGGSEIFLRNMTGAAVNTNIAGGIGATPGKTWVNVRPDPQNTAPAGLTVTANAAIPAFTRFLVPITQTTGTFSNADAFKPVALEAMTLTISGSSSPIHFRNAAFILRNVTVSGLANGAASPFTVGSGTQKQQVAQAMGVVCDDATANYAVSAVFALHGCRFKRGRFEDAARSTFTLMDPFDGIHWVSTMFLDQRNVSAPTIGANNALVHGFHAVNFIVEATAAAGSGGSWRLGGDGSVRAMDNVLLAYTTVPGTTPVPSGPPIERLNLAYTDVAAAVGVKKHVAIRFSILHQVNTKTDTFTDVTALTGRTRNWETRYGVGHRGNVRVLIDNNGGTWGGANGWTGEAQPPGSAINVSVGFTDNEAGPSAAGSGNYTLTGPANAAFDRVPAGAAMCGFDLAGLARRNDGTGAAGAFERGL